MIHYILCLFTFILVSFSVRSQDLFSLRTDTLWTINMDKYSCTEPFADDSFIYVGADRSPVTCINQLNGKVKWTIDYIVQEGKKGFIHPIRGDKNGHLYFHGESSGLYSAFKENGKIRWTLPLKFDDDLFSKITLDRQCLYINPNEDKFYCISLEGVIKWQTDLPSCCIGYELNEGNIYCQTYLNGLYVINQNNGRIVRTDTNIHNNRYLSLYPFVIGNILYIHAGIDSIVAMDKNTGKLIWSTNKARYSLKLMNDLYAFNDSQFYKLNPTDGNIIWQVKGKFGWYLQPVIYRDYIYIQSRFNVYVLNKNTGNILIQANDMNKTYTRPIIIGDKIFMGMANKYQAIRNPMFGK